MNCTTAVFTLMSGTALLSFATIYTYNRNILSDIKLKMSNLNVALTSLQAERSDLINKSNDMYVETATKSILAENYKAELDALRETVNRLQSDNESLKSESNKEEMDVMTLTINRLHFDKQVLEAENKQQLGAISEKMNVLEQENALLKAENNKEELANLNATINRLQTENRRLKMDTNREEFDLLKETVTRLQNDNELLINAYRQMEKRVYA
jgi:chromosome segregation ATPase